MAKENKSQVRFTEAKQRQAADYSMKHGALKAAEKFGTSTVSIRNWRIKFKLAKPTARDLALKRSENEDRKDARDLRKAKAEETKFHKFTKAKPAAKAKGSKKIDKAKVLTYAKRHGKVAAAKAFKIAVEDIAAMRKAA